MKQTEIRVASFDVFPNSTLKPAALLRYMQQLAREDCDGLGCTYRFMRSHNTVFVLTQIGLRFFRPVFEGETVTLATYNDGVGPLVFDRGFEWSVGGERAGICSSKWVLVRYDTRSIVRPRDFPVDFGTVVREHETVDIPRRFPSDGAAEVARRTVNLSDLDENNHLNNCVYADVACDSVPGFDGLSRWCSEILVNFRHEARRGDVLSVSHREAGGAHFVFALNETSGEPCFESELRFGDLPARDPDADKNE